MAGREQLSYAPERKIIQYEPAMDRRNYGDLQAMRFAGVGEYEKKKQGVDGLTSFNLKTALAERFNTLISERIDTVIDGKICDISTKEPLEDMYERGKNYRARHGSSVHDRQRESAEVNSFTKTIQPVLLDSDTPIGTVIVSISPPGGEGSIYQHNFVDLFEKAVDDRGNVIIKSVRKASSLSLEEYAKIAKVLSPTNPSAIDLSDVYFLENQIIVKPHAGKATTEQLLQYFHKQEDGKYMGKELFGQIIEAVTPYIHAYIDLLARDPHNEEQQLLYYRAILNKADAQWRALQEGKPRFAQVVSVDGKSGPLPTYMQIRNFGTQKVREVTTGCGFSGDVTSSQSLPFSVKDFGTEIRVVGEDKYGSLEFECPNKKCKKTNDRPYGKLIENCKHCGESVRCD